MSTQFKIIPAYSAKRLGLQQSWLAQEPSFGCLDPSAAVDPQVLAQIQVAWEAAVSQAASRHKEALQARLVFKHYEVLDIVTSLQDNANTSDGRTWVSWGAGVLGAEALKKTVFKGIDYSPVFGMMMYSAVRSIAQSTALRLGLATGMELVIGASLASAGVVTGVGLLAWYFLSSPSQDVASAPVDVPVSPDDAKTKDTDEFKAFEKAVSDLEAQLKEDPRFDLALAPIYLGQALTQFGRFISDKNPLLGQRLQYIGMAGGLIAYHSAQVDQAVKQLQDLSKFGLTAASMATPVSMIVNSAFTLANILIRGDLGQDKSVHRGLAALSEQVTTLGNYMGEGLLVLSRQIDGRFDQALDLLRHISASQQRLARELGAAVWTTQKDARTALYLMDRSFSHLFMKDLEALEAEAKALIHFPPNPDEYRALMRQLIVALSVTAKGSKLRGADADLGEYRRLQLFQNAPEELPNYALRVWQHLMPSELPVMVMGDFSDLPNYNAIIRVIKCYETLYEFGSRQGLWDSWITPAHKWVRDQILAEAMPLQRALYTCQQSTTLVDLLGLSLKEAYRDWSSLTLDDRLSGSVQANSRLDRLELAYLQLKLFAEQVFPYSLKPMLQIPLNGTSSQLLGLNRSLLLNSLRTIQGLPEREQVYALAKRDAQMCLALDHFGLIVHQRAENAKRCPEPIELDAVLAIFSPGITSDISFPKVELAGLSEYPYLAAFEGKWVYEVSETVAEPGAAVAEVSVARENPFPVALLTADEMGRLPLHWAVENEQVDWVKRQLALAAACGSAILSQLCRHRDSGGNTPLHLAAMHNHGALIIAELVAADAQSVGYRNHFGKTALDIAAERHMTGRVKPSDFEFENAAGENAASISSTAASETPITATGIWSALKDAGYITADGYITAKAQVAYDHFRLHLPTEIMGIEPQIRTVFHQAQAGTMKAHIERGQTGPSLDWAGMPETELFRELVPIRKIIGQPSSGPTFWPKALVRGSVFVGTSNRGTEHGFCFWERSLGKEPQLIPGPYHRLYFASDEWLIMGRASGLNPSARTVAIDIVETKSWTRYSELDTSEWSDMRDPWDSFRIARVHNGTVEAFYLSTGQLVCGHWDLKKGVFLEKENLFSWSGCLESVFYLKDSKYVIGLDDPDARSRNPMKHHASFRKSFIYSLDDKKSIPIEKPCRFSPQRSSLELSAQYLPGLNLISPGGPCYDLTTGKRVADKHVVRFGVPLSNKGFFGLIHVSDFAKFGIRWAAPSGDAYHLVLQAPDLTFLEHPNLTGKNGYSNEFVVLEPGILLFAKSSDSARDVIGPHREIWDVTDPENPRLIREFDVSVLEYGF